MTPLYTTLRKILIVLILLSPDGSWAQTKWKDFNFFSSDIGRVEIQAGTLTAREGGKRILLQEGVLLTGNNLEVRADQAEIWAEEERVVLSGAVKVIEGTSVLLCDRLEITRPSASALIDNAVILVKQAVTPQKLTACRTASQLVDSGHNAITLQGETLKKDQESYDIDWARFTACDCQDEAPSWEIRSSSADVLPEERAWLYWPVLYLKGIPVFVLPVAYLPLSERRTGLLFPQFNYSGRDGFVLSESFFLTLGRSVDTTFSLDWFEDRGFRERLEFRTRPTRRSWMDVRLMYMRDEKADYKDETLDEALKERYSLELDGGIDWSNGASLRSSLRLYSDSDIIRHFNSEMIGRAVVDAPSTVVLDVPGTNLLWTADLLYRQDLRYGGVDLTGSDAHDTIHRLGALTLSLMPTRFFDWPLETSFTLEIANLSSLSSAWRDWGIDGTFNERERKYTDSAADHSKDNHPLCGEFDGQLGEGELRRAVRLMVEPDLRLPLRIGRYLSLLPYLGHRQLTYIPHGPEAPDASTRGMSFGNLQVGTQLSRTFGEGDDRIGHVISPSVSLAGAWRGLSTGGVRHYLDFRDRPFEDAFQLLAGIDTGLYHLPNGWQRFLRLGLTQGIDLRQNRISQGAAHLDFSMYPLRTGMSLYYDWDLARLAEVDASAAFADRRGDSVRISFLYLPSFLDASGRPLPLSERTQREDGLLFGLQPAHFRALGESIKVLEGIARVQIGWGLGFNAGANLNLEEKKLSWYGGGVSYNSDCRCWGFSLMVRMLKGQDFPDILFQLDLAYLGAAGVGTNTRF